ncbi:hypothetical protein HGRIS_003164 [Hohenbuehelia grisea]
MQAIIVPLGILVLTLLLYTFKQKIQSKSHGRNYPPGPTLKQFGNNAIPGKPWVQYTELAKKYGPIMHFDSGGGHIVVLSTEQAANDLFEKRSRLYSSRSQNPVLDLMGWDWAITFLPYADEWRAQRRMIHQGLRLEAIKQHQPLQLRKLQEILQYVLDDPSNFAQSYRMLSASITMQAVYGYTVEGPDDRFVAIAEEAVKTLETAVMYSGVLASRSLHFLRYLPAWFPGASSRRMAEDAAPVVRRMADVPFAFVKDQIAQGKSSACLASDLLESHRFRQGTEVEEALIKHTTAAIYGGAADTTTSSILFFILAMILHPHAAKRAQAEIDSFLRGVRLPTFEDRPHLPYIEAIFREVLRWRPAIPLGVPHAVIDDDVYEGYFIPKGTTLIGNIWAMTRDNNRYPDPETFKPERYLDTQGKFNGDTVIHAWGFGRRICPGRYFADATVWATIACSLAVFDFAFAKDENGQEIPVNADDVTDTLVV